MTNPHELPRQPIELGDEISNARFLTERKAMPPDTEAWLEKEHPEASKHWQEMVAELAAAKEQITHLEKEVSRLHVANRALSKMGTERGTGR